MNTIRSFIAIMAISVCLNLATSSGYGMSILDTSLGMDVSDISQLVTESYQSFFQGSDRSDNEDTDNNDKQHAPQASSQKIQSTYPYVLMSYFAEMHKVSSRNEEKQKAITARTTWLDSKGYTLITNPQKIPEDWRKDFEETTEQRIVLPDGLKVRLYENKDQQKLIVAIAGTDFANPTSIVSALSLYYNWGFSSAAAQAFILVADLQAMYPGYNIELTGASQGGAIAQYVASLTPNIKVTVFNSETLHPALTNGLNDENVTHLYVEGEALNPSVNSGATFSSLLIPVSPELGENIKNTYYRYYKGFSSYFTPSAYYTPKSIIRHWTGSLLQAVEFYEPDGLCTGQKLQ